MNALIGKWPGIVKAYDGAKRLCTVAIPGITDGSSEFPEATLCNPIGDKAGDTEIRILPGDAVWLEFEAGDARFPIIVGYRTPREGNPVDWRRWAHANIDMTADVLFKINATTIELNADTIKLNGNVQIAGSGVTHNGTNIGDSHVHGGVDVGPGDTATPH